jgi:hypothetical protein
VVGEFGNQVFQAVPGRVAALRLLPVRGADASRNRGGGENADGEQPPPEGSNAAAQRKLPFRIQARNVW